MVTQLVGFCSAVLRRLARVQVTLATFPGQLLNAKVVFMTCGLSLDLQQTCVLLYQFTGSFQLSDQEKFGITMLLRKGLLPKLLE